MSIIQRAQQKITATFHRLNERGINPGGRLQVQLEVWGSAGESANKMKRGQLSLVEGSVVPLVPIDIRIGDVRRWDEQLGERKTVGDARLEIARNQPDNTPLTLEQLTGDNLPAGQELRARVGDDLYLVVPGSVEDPQNGFTWFITLKKADFDAP